MVPLNSGLFIIEEAGRYHVFSLNPFHKHKELISLCVRPVLFASSFICISFASSFILIFWAHMSRCLPLPTSWAPPICVHSLSAFVLWAIQCFNACRSLSIFHNRLVHFLVTPCPLGDSGDSQRYLVARNSSRQKSAARDGRQWLEWCPKIRIRSEVIEYGIK